MVPLDQRVQLGQQDHLEQQAEREDARSIAEQGSQRQLSLQSLVEFISKQIALRLAIRGSRNAREQGILDGGSGQDSQEPSTGVSRLETSLSLEQQKQLLSDSDHWWI